MRHTVTIGIPTYNRVVHLKNTLESLRNQTYKNIEIIISDNASTDETPEMVQAYIKKDKRIKYYRHQKHIPAINNFNYALFKSKGNYFMWAADDDLWDKSFISEAINKFIENGDAVLVATKFAAMDNNGVIRSDKKCSFYNYKRDVIDFKTYLAEDFYHFKADIFYGIYKTKVLKKIGGYNPLPVLAASDCLTVHRIMAEGKVVLVNKTLFFKRENFFNYPTEENRSKMLSTFFTIIVSLAKTLGNSLANLLPNNFSYIYKNVAIYFNYNKELIRNNFPNERLILYWINLLSSINLFTALFPNSINVLRKRNLIFSGKFK